MEVKCTVELQAYHSLVADLAGRVLDAAGQVVGGATPVTADSVALGVPAARLLLTGEAALHHALVAGFRTLAGIGRSAATTGLMPMMRTAMGDRRPIYHPLVLHLHLAAFEKAYEEMPAGLWSACEDAIPDAIAPSRSIETWADTPPPHDQVDQVLWHSLCVLEQASLLSRDVDVELVESVVHAALSQPGPAGALHPYESDDSPDAWTYRELTGLHALANLALRRRNQTWARRVQEVAMYHLDHTQPDYTTYEPWAVFAFAWSPATSLFADQQLHDVQTHLAAGGPMTGIVPGLLLTDAAYALGQFTVA